MNPAVGWALALLLLAAAWQRYGWRGAAFAFSAIVFWLLLQFGRSMRALRAAAGAPVGFIANAVMFNARLRRGMPMMQIVTLTGSLGRKVSDSPECWCWSDAGGAAVSVVLDKGRLRSWTLERPTEP